MLKNLWRVAVTAPRQLSSTAEAAKPASTKKYGKNLTGTQQMIDHLQTSEQFVTHLSRINPSFLRMRSAVPVGMYCMSESVAEKIFTSIRDHLVPDTPIVELNPGLGLLTRHLLTLNPRVILGYENDLYFKSVMEPIASENSKVLKIQKSEFLRVWKEGFKDKLDGGNRVEEFLPGVERKGWDSDPMAQIIGIIPNPRFFQYLVHCVTFQSGIISLGRPELYLIVPPEIFWFINCEAISLPAKYSKYILFNIFFDYEMLCQVDGKCFVPWFRRGARKTAFLKKYDVNRENYYLMKAVPKRDLLKVVPPNLLTSFWFFVYQGTTSTRNKVIPFLERWIPGCGPLFISKGLNIFTEFRDLKYKEILDVFFTFVSLPEFEDCPFRAALDSYMNRTDDEALADAVDTTTEDSGHSGKVLNRRDAKDTVPSVDGA